jgi:hypothetical protein
VSAVTYRMTIILRRRIDRWRDIAGTTTCTGRGAPPPGGCSLDDSNG